LQIPLKLVKCPGFSNVFHPHIRFWVLPQNQLIRTHHPGWNSKKELVGITVIALSRRSVVVLAGGFCARGPARIPRRNYVLKNEMFARVGDNGGFVFLINAPTLEEGPLYVLPHLPL